MNTIMNVTPNYTYDLQARKQNIQFRGNLGDKFVNKIINGTSVQPAEIIKEMKGTFGIKTDKAEDILESFIGKVRELFKDRMSLSMKLNEQDRKIKAFPKEKREALWDAESKLRQSFREAMQTKNEEIAAKDKELADMKTQLEKYQQVAKVKSIKEIGTIMPDEAIKLIDELMANKIPARKSIAEFLLTGKGQEDALKQIERNNKIMKAHQDGICQIPEVDAKVRDMKNASVYYSNDFYFTLNMIENALKGTPKGSYLKSSAIKKQIKENALAILKPMADERYSNTNAKFQEKELDGRLEIVEKYHDGLSKGIEKIKKRIGKDIKNVEFKPVEFSPEESKLIITENNGKSYEQPYQCVSHYGTSCWE